MAERERLTPRIRELLAGDPDTLATFDAAMTSAAVWLAGRERTKTSIIRLLGEVRVCLLELARRMVARGVLDHENQIFMLMADELDAFRFNPERFTEIVRQREHDYLELFELEPPFIVDTVVPPLGSWKRRADRSLAPVAARHRAHRHRRQRRHGHRPGPGAAPTRPTLRPSNLATCSWLRAPTRPGRRCSCPPGQWSRASARSAATR